MVTKITHNSRVCKGGKKRGEVKGRRKNFRGGGRECRLRENGATQSAPYFSSIFLNYYHRLQIIVICSAETYGHIFDLFIITHGFN